MALEALVDLPLRPGPAPCSRARGTPGRRSCTCGRRAGSATARAGASSARTAAAAASPRRSSAAIARSKPAVASSRGEPREHVAPQVRPALRTRRSVAGLEPLPHAVDRRQPLAQVVRQQQVLHDDLEVGLERLAGGRACRRARRAHSRVGHRSVIGSTTVSAWLRSNSVNRLRGWSRAVGSVPCRGCSPVSCAGTAAAVRSSTVVALRYQVDVAREPREVREQLRRRSSPSAPTSVAQRQLVEHDVHDRRRRAAPGPRPRRRLAREQQRRARARRRGTGAARSAARARAR